MYESPAISAMDVSTATINETLKCLDEMVTNTAEAFPDVQKNLKKKVRFYDVETMLESVPASARGFRFDLPETVISSGAFPTRSYGDAKSSRRNSVKDFLLSPSVATPRTAGLSLFARGSKLDNPSPRKVDSSLSPAKAYIQPANSH